MVGNVGEAVRGIDEDDVPSGVANPRRQVKVQRLGMVKQFSPLQNRRRVFDGQQIEPRIAREDVLPPPLVMLEE